MLRVCEIIIISSLFVTSLVPLTLGLESINDVETEEVLAEEYLGEDDLAEVAESRAGLKEMFYQSPNQKINKYLLENETSEDARLNMLKINELLSKKAENKSIFEKSLLEALRRLSELSDISQAGNKCDRDAYIALSKNTRAHKLVQKRHLLASEGIPLRRIDNVVNQYSIQHAKDCQDIYPIILKTRYEQLDMKSTQRLESLLNPIIDLEIKTQRNNNPDVTKSAVLYTNFINKAHLVNGLRDGQSVYESLEVIARHDQSGYLRSPGDGLLITDIVYKDRVKFLLEKYLLKPCEYYINRLGDDIFIPAQHDALFYNEVDDSKLDYYYAFARFRLCQVLVGNNQALTRILVKFSEEEE